MSGACKISTGPEENPMIIPLSRPINILLLILTLMLSSFMPMHAQDESSGLDFGIRGGWNYSGIYYKGDRYYAPLNSFYVGLFSEAYSSKYMNTGWGVEFMQIGFEDNNQIFENMSLSFPFYLKPQLGPVFMKIIAGLNLRLTDNSNEFSQIKESGLLDVPIGIGAGIQIDPVFLEFRYLRGIFSPLSIGGSGFEYRYMQLGFGLFF